MRILLDESVPGRLGSLLVGHATNSVQRKGWAGIKSGRVLALAAAEFDVLLTADKGIDFPWFKDATIGELCNIEYPTDNHLYWPSLDVDLAVESIRTPSAFPLVSAVRV